MSFQLAHGNYANPTPQSVLTLLGNGYDVVRKKSLPQVTPFLLIVLFKEAI